MTYSQKANPNATNSELDAKTILQRGVEDCELPVSLTEEQISTILYIMEGYIVNSDDTNDEQFNKDVDDIFGKEIQPVKKKPKTKRKFIEQETIIEGGAQPDLLKMALKPVGETTDESSSSESEAKPDEKIPLDGMDKPPQ